MKMQKNCSTCKQHKYNIDGFLIVEGTTDKAFLTNFLNCEIVFMGGYALPRGTIDYILQLSQVLQPIILSDPDEAGRLIDSRLKKIITNAQSALIDFNPLKINQKNGVAESTKEEILRVLNPYIIDYELPIGNITIAQLYELGLNNKNKRKFLQKQLHLGDVNLKCLVKRINYLNIKLSTIIETLKKYGNQSI